MPRDRLGNVGSNAHQIKLRILMVLDRSDARPLERLEIVERGWPDIYYDPDQRPGTIAARGWMADEDVDACLDARHRRSKLEADVSAALSYLRRIGFVESALPDGHLVGRKLYTMTPDGGVWLQQDLAEFRCSVERDLSRLPVLAR